MIITDLKVNLSFVFAIEINILRWIITTGHLKGDESRPSFCKDTLMASENYSKRFTLLSKDF